MLLAERGARWCARGRWTRRRSEARLMWKLPLRLVVMPAGMGSLASLGMTE